LKVIFSGEMKMVLMERQAELEDCRESEALNAAAILVMMLRNSRRN